MYCFDHPDQVSNLGSQSWGVYKTVLKNFHTKEGGGERQDQLITSREKHQ